MQENHNVVNQLKYQGVFAISKHYTDLERFECELAYIRQFSSKGFLTPVVLTANPDQLIIVFKKITGKCNRYLSGPELTLCINQLVAIQQRFLISDKKKARLVYCQKVSDNISTYSQNQDILIDWRRLTNILVNLEQYFICGLFKDAKPTNWIFQNGRVHLLDFDYIRESFFLADLAQLMSYQMINRSVNLHQVLDYFLSKLGITNSQSVNYYHFFLLAIINSDIASQVHNDSLSVKTTKQFQLQIKHFLSELDLLK